MSMPASPYADRQRDGTASLIRFAKLLCGIVTAFGHIITSKFADKPAVINLYEAAQALCALLPAAEAALYDPTGDNTGLPEDPAEIPGVDPGAPAPPTPIEP